MSLPTASGTPEAFLLVGRLQPQGDSISKTDIMVSRMLQVGGLAECLSSFCAGPVHEES